MNAISSINGWQDVPGTTSLPKKAERPTRCESKWAVHSIELPEN